MKNILILYIMYLNLCAQTTIGKVTFNNITSAEIKESVIELSDTATLVVPRNYTLKDKSVLDYIKVGDKATIKLGYDNELFEEFSGYVREIEAGTPLKIHLDDEMYQLKKTNFTKAWKTVSLKELLKYIKSGLKIDCPEVNLGKFSINKASAYMVLQELKRQYGLYSYIKNDVIHCGFAFDIGLKSFQNHTYEIKKNVKKNNLKYKRKEDFKIKITAISNLPNGKKLKVDVGSTEPRAIRRTLNFGKKTKEELKELATKELSRLRFDGYTGTITGFGIPRTKAGDSLTIIDVQEKDREGTYLIEAVTKRFTNAHYEHENKLSYKV